jgi:hypothetical protein
MSYVVAFDFEAAGGIPSRHAFTQLGAVIVNVDTDEVVSEFNMYANMKGYEWEERCVKEFWEKQPERYAETKKAVESAPLGPHEVVAEFIKWVKTHCADFKDVFLLTDNAPFDAGILRCFSADQDISYIFGKYRSIVESSRFFAGLGRKRVSVDTLWSSSTEIGMEGVNADRKKLKETPIPPIKEFTVQHDHHPVNDAKCIAWTWNHFQRNLPK